MSVDIEQTTDLIKQQTDAVETLRSDTTRLEARVAKLLASLKDSETSNNDHQYKCLMKNVKIQRKLLRGVKKETSRLFCQAAKFTCKIHNLCHNIGQNHRKWL